MEVEGWAGFGRKGWPQFWFGAGDGARKPMQIAFVAENRAKMRAFYEAALRAGAKDNGPPGIRETCHPNYYGAFVIGPDGHGSRLSRTGVLTRRAPAMAFSVLKTVLDVRQPFISWPEAKSTGIAELADMLTSPP